MGERRYLASDLGIQTEDGFHELLRRGDRLPRRARVTLRTGEDDQTGMEFTLLQRLDGAWSTAFRQARIDGLPPGPRGTVKIRLEVEIAADGELAARIGISGRKGTTEIARGRAATADRDGLDRAIGPGAGVGLVERGLMAPGRLETPADPLTHGCDACGETISFRAVSLVAPPMEGLTCDDCGNVLALPPLDNMAASFFGKIPGGRIGLAVAPGSVEPARIAAQGEAIARLESALRPCPCGGRFGALTPARCPSCRAPFVSYGNDPLFRARQTHLPLVAGAKIVAPTGPRRWTAEHLAPFEADVSLGALGRRDRHLVLPIAFRNRDGWLVIPLAYALVLRDATGRELRAFRPVPTGEGGPSSPEEWQALQTVADEGFVAEVERELGLRPLIGAVEPDARVEGHAVFPVTHEPTEPFMLEVGRALELPLA